MSEQNPDYWERVRAEAARLGTDGCSSITQVFQDCCFEHDIGYRTGADVDGNPLNRGQVDAAFRRCMQSHSKVGKASPIAAVRWVAVRAFGWRGWRKSREAEKRKADEVFT